MNKAEMEIYNLHFHGARGRNRLSNAWQVCCLLENACRQQQRAEDDLIFFVMYWSHTRKQHTHTHDRINERDESKENKGRHTITQKTTVERRRRQEKEKMHGETEPLGARHEASGQHSRIPVHRLSICWKKIQAANPLFSVPLSHPHRIDNKHLISSLVQQRWELTSSPDHLVGWHQQGASWKEGIFKSAKKKNADRRETIIDDATARPRRGGSRFLRSNLLRTRTMRAWMAHDTQ